MDRLSNLPSGIVEKILCLVPIQEAGRTSILSKEWRYRWTKIPNLVFDEKTFQVSTADGAESSILDQTHEHRFNRQTMDKKSKLIYAILQVLLFHDGPVNEFTLSLCQSRKHVKIDPILTYLSRKTRVKKLKFDFAWGEQILPLSHYSFRHLTDLHLVRCYFHLPPTSNGFGSLTSLYLEEVIISTRTLKHLLSNCPLLKTVILDIRDPCISDSIGGPTFSEILECLRVIETFSISFHRIRAFWASAVDKVPGELSTTLIHLKYLRIDGVYFNSKVQLSNLALLIKSSPNLEKLKVSDNSKLEISKKKYCFRAEDYSDIMLGSLKELEITSFIKTKNQLDFVRLILARSPVLKKVRIFLHSNIPKKEKSKVKSQILKNYSVTYPCASSEIQIILVD